MCVRRYLVAVLTLVLLSAGPVAAQTLRRADAFGRLKFGSTARVRPISGERFEGAVVSMNSDTLGLWANNRLVEYTLADIDSLRAKGTFSRHGAVVGAVLGFLPIGVSCARELDECGLIPLGIVLPVVGAGLGAVVGGCLPRWLLRYARTGPG